MRLEMKHLDEMKVNLIGSVGFYFEWKIYVVGLRGTFIYRSKAWEVSNVYLVNCVEVSDNGETLWVKKPSKEDVLDDINRKAEDGNLNYLEFTNKYGNRFKSERSIEDYLNCSDVLRKVLQILEFNN